MTGSRWFLGALGVVGGAYGAWLLVSRQESAQLWSVARWLVGGVLLNDGVLAALVLILALVVVRLVPQPARAPITVGAIVLGSVTLLAVPVLGRYGARPDNATLLDRDYGLGWWWFASLVVLAVVVALVTPVVVRAARTRRARGR